MKKLIVLILVVAIFGGIGYFFLANDMSMTTIISQDKERIAGMLNRAAYDRSEATSYDTTFKIEKYEDGVTKETYKAEFQISEKSSVYNLYAKVTIANTVSDDTNGTKTVYYDGTNLYAKFVSKSGTTTYDIRPATMAEAISEISADFFDLTSLKNYDPLTVDDLDNEAISLTTKSHIAFSFSPFYIGARVVSETEVSDGVFDTTENVIDVTGKLRKTSEKTGTSTNYTKNTLEFNKINSVTAKPISAATKDEWQTAFDAQ